MSVFILYGLVLLTLIPSCRESEVIEYWLFTLSDDQILVDGEASRQTVRLTASMDWKIENPTAQDGWCSISPVSGKAGTTELTVEFQANDDNPRDYEFYINSDGIRVASLYVVQELLLIEFEDVNFMNYCRDQFDLNGDMVLTRNELRDVQNISVPSAGIRSLCGIEEFENLEELYCDDNDMTELDLSKNTKLRILDCGNNQLTSLDLRNNTALEHLDCSFNELTSLDVSSNIALTNLGCTSNELTTLDVSNNTALEHLGCSFNELTSLDVSSNIALKDFGCVGNKLTSLNLSNNTALTRLDCNGNELASLVVSGNTALEYLRCNGNQLTSLDLSKNTALTRLDCERNRLAFLDLRNNAALETLLCYSNDDIKYLDVSMLHNLKSLNCINYIYLNGEVEIYYDTKLPLEILKIYRHNIIGNINISVLEEVYGDVLEYVK